MPWIYGIELKIRPKKKLKNYEEFAKKIIKGLYATYQIKSIEENNNQIIIKYVYMAGAEIKNQTSSIQMHIDYATKNFDLIKEYTMSEKFMIHKKIPNYLEYYAKKIHQGEKPLDHKTFWDEISKGKYWENL